MNFFRSRTIFDPVEHEPLTDAPFVRDKARAFIADTVRTVDALYTQSAGWMLHPEDDYGKGKTSTNLGIYYGAAGSILALMRLAERYDVPLQHDYAHEIERCDEQYQRDEKAANIPSYWMGSTGIALVRYMITGDEDALRRCVLGAERNAGNPTREFMWGAPGTVFPALLLRERDADDRFDGLIRSVHDELWETWEPKQLWLQDLYGSKGRYIGAGHGAITNIAVLVRAFDLLSPARQIALKVRIKDFLRRYAITNGDAANWYATAQPLSGKRMQWCHGAAGIITGLGALDRSDAEVEDWLRRGGNGIWRAGPLKKGPTLCHGTAGNGFAFLRLAERTGDEEWFRRAEHFAIHAIAQTGAWRIKYGMPSASLWTGDLGVALYIDAVLRQDPRILSHDTV